MGGKLTLIAILCVILADYLHYYLIRAYETFKKFA